MKYPAPSPHSNLVSKVEISNKQYALNCVPEERKVVKVGRKKIKELIK